MREISIEGQKKVRIERNSSVPNLAWVKLSQIVIDEAYQRPLGKSNWRAIRNIAENFDWSMFSPVMVSVSGNRYALIDGQHRAHAAALCGLDQIPAMIVDLPREGQAKAFSWINGSATNITTFHIYRAALAAKEDWALRSRTAVDNAGCILMEANKSTNAKKSGEIFSIALIKELILADGDKAITDGLAAIRAIDTSNSRVALYSADLLRPWLKAVASSKYVDLVPVLQNEDPYRTFSRAEAEASTIRNASKRAIYKAAFVERIKALGGHVPRRRAA